MNSGTGGEVLVQISPTNYHEENGPWDGAWVPASVGFWGITINFDGVLETGDLWNPQDMGMGQGRL